jgi:aromatic-L-amino-acid decarboxylase
VCFRLKGTDELNQKLLSNINASGKIHMVPASVNEKYVIRFCAVVQNAMEEHIGASFEKEILVSQMNKRAICLCGFGHGRFF